MDRPDKLPRSQPKLVDKPWGREEWLAVGERVALKRIVVHAGQRLSLQLHRRKEEAWLIVRGRARVRFDNIEGELWPGDVLHVPPNTVHRIEALEDVELIEASTAELTDVVRLEDDYGRQRGATRARDCGAGGGQSPEDCPRRLRPAAERHSRRIA